MQTKLLTYQGEQAKECFSYVKNILCFNISFDSKNSKKTLKKTQPTYKKR